MNKLNIKEANEHLKQLHRKVFELENQVHMHTLHTQELERTNTELRKRLEATEQSKKKELAAKEAQNAELHQRLSECESRVDVLLEVAEEHDRLVEKLEKRAQLFYEVVEHRSALGRIVEVFDEIHKEKESALRTKTPAQGNRGKQQEDNDIRTYQADTNGITHSPTNSTSSNGDSPSKHHISSDT